jgi:MOSC domain-containing protein YiiM
MRMEMPRFPKLFLESGRTGFYLRVLEEGELAAGDGIELVSRDPAAPTVRETVRGWRER